MEEITVSLKIKIGNFPILEAEDILDKMNPKLNAEKIITKLSLVEDKAFRVAEVYATLNPALIENKRCIVDLNILREITKEMILLR